MCVCVDIRKMSVVVLTHDAIKVAGFISWQSHELWCI